MASGSLQEDFSKFYVNSSERPKRKYTRIAMMQCKGCATPFKRKDNRELYCSKQCSDSYRKKIYLERRLDIAKALLESGKPHCSMDDCGCAAEIRGFCKYHYAVGLKSGDIKRSSGVRPIIACRACGAEFKRRHAKHAYCSQECYYKDEILPARKRNVRICKTCSKPFLIRIGGKGRRGESNEGQFCSNACHHASRRTGEKHTNVSELQPFLYDELESRYKSWQHQVGARRRAKLFGVSYEVINPLKIFGRDRWKCQICGTKTPKRLRGTTDDCAPELDHRIPMSLGGSHTFDNVQCACKKCNMAKGNRNSTGQLNLFPRHV